MGLASKLTIAISAVLGLGIFSQAPEFAQQYRQRMGGAIDELRTVVEDFDRDAENSRMNRQSALDTLDRSDDRFLRDRSSSMRGTISRYERLAEQLRRLDAAGPLSRPLIVARNPDAQIAAAAWQSYEPALPLTAAGAGYGAAGALMLGLLARLGIAAGAGARRLRSGRRRAGAGTNGPHPKRSRSSVR